MQMLQVGYISDMQHLKKYFYKEKQWRRRGNRAKIEIGTSYQQKTASRRMVKDAENADNRMEK